jgi:Icc-related predicted phosphoesterase
MIRIGLGERQKQKVVSEYLNGYKIKKIFCFYFKKFPLKLNVDCDVEYIEYADIEMYKFFYPLLEKIDESSLIVINECMRTQNRSELIYNCAHHYLNQTPHRIIFEFFPIIESRQDFMILLDFENKGKYKGKGFDYVYLQNEDIKIKPFTIKLDTVPVEITDKDRERYEKKKEQLFANLGEKDPDTIPRVLQLLAGDMKKKAVEPGKLYVARNKRFKLDNVKSYQEIAGKGNYIVIDTHYRRLDFNDFLKTTKMNKIKYLCTVLPIDNVIINEFTKWKARCDAIYAQASLYK